MEERNAGELVGGLRIKRHYVVGGSGGGRYLPEQSRHVARNVFGVFAYPYELG
jgi:hypothetical protein